MVIESQNGASFSAFGVSWLPLVPFWRWSHWSWGSITSARWAEACHQIRFCREEQVFFSAAFSEGWEESDKCWWWVIGLSPVVVALNMRGGCWKYHLRVLTCCCHWGISLSAPAASFANAAEQSGLQMTASLRAMCMPVLWDLSHLRTLMLKPKLKHCGSAKQDTLISSQPSSNVCLMAQFALQNLVADAALLCTPMMKRSSCCDFATSTGLFFSDVVICAMPSCCCAADPTNRGMHLRQERKVWLWKKDSWVMLVAACTRT